MTVIAHAETPAIRSLLRCPALTVERERYLLRTCRASLSEKARQQALSELWENHSKLVVAIARQFLHPNLEMTDLVGAGHLGMQAAIQGFDPDRTQSRLSTYAIRWIRHYIQDYIRRHALPTRSPGSPAHHQLFRTTGRLFAEARRSCQREGVATSDDELCARVGARIGLPGDEVAQCLKLTRCDAARVNSADASTRLIDGLATFAPSPEEATIHRLDRAKLRRRTLVLAKQILGERERMVFLARCMANEEPAAHPECLAAQLGVTRERVHQLEASARRKIAVALTHDGLLECADGTVDRTKSRAGRRAHGNLVEAPG